MMVMEQADVLTRGLRDDRGGNWGACRRQANLSSSFCAATGSLILLFNHRLLIVIAVDRGRYNGCSTIMTNPPLDIHDGQQQISENEWEMSIISIQSLSILSSICSSNRSNYCYTPTSLNLDNEDLRFLTPSISTYYLWGSVLNLV